MITNQMAAERDKLIKEIYAAQKQSAYLLNQQDNQQEIAHLMYEWQSYKLFLVANSDITKISLEEWKETHKQVMDLLEQVKQL
ncbi:hypothetical protein [Bacillus sp. NPDC094106]|uniref:hypothetical protein n=1 Tax=Bacillus sp. NPDC094106 TaxID=3363949 RepID=UPI0037F842A6